MEHAFIPLKQNKAALTAALIERGVLTPAGGGGGRHLHWMMVVMMMVMMTMMMMAMSIMLKLLVCSKKGACA